MAKYGKWIGAGLGLALGGPLGALFGLFIGSMFDNIQTIAIPSDGGPIPPGQTGRGDFTFSLTVLATAVMKADGRIMRSELDYVKTFLIRNFGIEATREAMQMIKELSTRDIPVDDVCQQIRFQMPEASKVQLLYFLFGIAKADGTGSTGCTRRGIRFNPRHFCYRKDGSCFKTIGLRQSVRHRFRCRSDHYGRRKRITGSVDPLSQG